MRTIITLDIDSERPQQIIISKPEEMLGVSETSELKDVVLNDIVGLTESLCLLVESAIEKGFMPKESLIRNLVNRINSI